MNRGRFALLLYPYFGYCSTIFWYIYGQISRGEALVLQIGLVIVGSDNCWLWSVFGYSSLLELISSFALVVRQFWLLVVLRDWNYTNWTGDRRIGKHPFCVLDNQPPLRLNFFLYSLKYLSILILGLFWLSRDQSYMDWTGDSRIGKLPFYLWIISPLSGSTSPVVWFCFPAILIQIFAGSPEIGIILLSGSLEIYFGSAISMLWRFLIALGFSDLFHP
jgi:hypothetical protein